MQNLIVRSRYENRALVERLRAKISNLPALDDARHGQSGFTKKLFHPERDSFSHASRTDTIGNAPSLSESTVGGKPAYLKSVHQRTQAAIHACVKAMFSDWLRLNIRIVKNAMARPKETTKQARQTLLGLLCPLG